TPCRFRDRLRSQEFVRSNPENALRTAACEIQPGHCQACPAATRGATGKFGRPAPAATGRARKDRSAMRNVFRAGTPAPAPSENPESSQGRSAKTRLRPSRQTFDSPGNKTPEAPGGASGPCRGDAVLRTTRSKARRVARADEETWCRLRPQSARSVRARL